MNVVERKQLHARGIWVDKGDKQIRVTEMDDFHLVSTFKHICKLTAFRVRSRCAASLFRFSVHEQETMMVDILESAEIWPYLVRELKYRGIIEGGDEHGHNWLSE